ncbi:J domain-containing protein [Geothrix paludis]|uniref:J domain-containing protein n=1 Tax=Geothrix paludis TaxID=2922722 RepID=UPI001FAE45F3|nr:J domain-containing protein [Geothrix paludis]
MTKWEALDTAAADKRVRDSARALNLAVRMGDPPAFQAMYPGTGAFVQALATLRSGPRPIRMLALRCALELALGSCSLPLSQNLVLRTVAEALGLEITELEAACRERTGAGLPPLWDPSRPEAWPAAGAGRPGPKAGTGAPGEGGRIAWIKALALLGLEEGATKEEIRRAFHRISKVHHPDHYAAHGIEATHEAELAFRRIREAYDFLMQAKP